MQKMLKSAAHALGLALALTWGNLSALAAPLIYRQPTNQVVILGKDVAFTVGATGLPPVSYQWRHELVNIFRGTNATLLITNAQPFDAGKYTVLISDSTSATFSQPAMLLVVMPLEIVEQPRSQTMTVGGTASFSVTVTGSPPLRFQWMFNELPLLNATNASLMLSNVTAAAAGNYSVQVWNPGDLLLSAPATLTVLEPPIIVTQPLSQTVVAGSPVTLAVTVNNNRALAYQWTFNGTALAGETNATLTRASARLEHAGFYRVHLSNPDGTTVSDAAYLDVSVPELPWANQFASAVALQGVTYLLGHGTNIGATLEPGEPRHDGQRHAHSVWLAWTAPASGIVSVSTIGSDFDTLLAIYTGNTLTNLTTVESDDDSGTNHTSKLQFNAVVGTTYQIAVSGYLLAQGNINLELELTPTFEHLPVISSHPRSYSVAMGDNAYFDVRVDADGPAELQWQFKGLALGNATNTSTTFNGVNDSMVGTYRMRVQTPTRTIYSRYADLQINSRGYDKVLAQDKLGGAGDTAQLISISGSGGTSVPSAAGGGKNKASSGGSGSRGYTTAQIFSTIGSGSDPGEPVHCGLGGGHSEWFAYQAEATGTLRLDTDGSNFDTVLAVYIGPGDSYTTLTNIACDNNSGSNGLTSKVMFNATLGEIYWIAVDGVGSAVGTVRLNINLGNPVDLSAQPQSKTVPSGTNVAFSVIASGMTNYSYQWRFGGTNVAGATSATFTRTNVPATLAGTYDVVVKNPLNAVTSSVATLTIYSGTLIITSQPQSRTVVAGTNTTWAVGASGMGLVRYQWRFNGTNLPAATNSSLTINNVQSTHAGLYAVNVTDANGAVLSSNATLTVLVPPTITLQPVSHTFPTGTVASLTASASGTPAPTYQWLFNGTALDGATSGTLTINNFQAEHEGTYALRASNSVGTVLSSPAELLQAGPLRFTNGNWSNGVFSARLVGYAGTNYVVQCSTNATDWCSIATNSSVSGLWIFSESGTNASGRMFRALVAP